MLFNINSLAQRAVFRGNLLLSFGSEFAEKNDGLPDEARHRRIRE